jgi:hypothetical protein
MSPAHNRRLAALTVASFVLGIALMVPFDYAITRALGVLALFGFIVSGVFLIADPDVIARDDDEAAALNARARG